MKPGLFFSLWLIAAFAGFGYTICWGFLPGKVANPSQPEFTKAGAQIQAIIHPLCPCSGASLELLHRAISDSGANPKLEIIFSGESQASKNVELARRIPGATLTFASEESITKRFGPATSGHMFIWRDKQLLFSGGITDARGENIEGAAYREFKLALRPGTKNHSRTLPTYGCPVQGER